MTIFDYLVLFVLATSILISTMRGLIKEILSLISWVVAFIAANAYGATLAKFLPAVIPGEAVRLLLAFVVLYVDHHTVETNDDRAPSLSVAVCH